MDTLLRWKRQFIGGLTSVPKHIVTGAAGALGTAIIAVLPLAFSWAADTWSGEEVIGILSQPGQPAVAVASQSGPACEQSAVTTPVQLATGSNFEIEVWKVRQSGNNLSGKIVNEDGVGHGQVSGFRKMKDGSTHVDTIFAGFNGATVGKGYYSLERGSKDALWKGTHTYFDCDTGATYKCPYLLGTARKDMVSDPWLRKPCVLEMLPSNEARFPSALSRSAQLEKGIDGN